MASPVLVRFSGTAGSDAGGQAAAAAASRPLGREGRARAGLPCAPTGRAPTGSGLVVDDAELIRRALEPRRKEGAGEGGAAGEGPSSGDDAFAELVGRYQERIFKLLYRFTKDTQEAEDLIQEVFIKVYRKLDTFQFDSSFYTWLYRVAVNTASDHASRRKKKRIALAEDISELDRGDGTHPRDPSRDREGPLDPLLREEMAAITRKILDGLPVKYRTVLILREYEDLSYNEIARTLECSIGTVESRLFRARQRFREELTRLHPDLLPGMP